MNGRLLLNALKGAGIALLISFVLLLLFNQILLQMPDPDSLLDVMAHTAQLIGAFLGGLLASRFHKERGFVVGGVTGVFYALLILLGSVFVDGSLRFLITLLLILLFIGAGALGGLLGTPGQKSSQARRKAMMKRMG